MRRRRFLVGAAAVGLTACSGSAATGDRSATGDDKGSGGATSVADRPVLDASLPEISMEMATSWPVALDTLYGGAEVFADRVATLTGGKFRITPRAGGEVAPALEVFDAIMRGDVPLGHTASYYYIERSPALAFGTTLPFGLTARQQNAWLYEAGGLQMLQELYAERFNMIQFPAGNTGVQMGGWFNKEINGLSDLRGLTMRIAGLGGTVLSRLGATVELLPGAEIFEALETGAIDAAEWIGPYDDEKLGLHNAARFYYYPGWWEPGTMFEVQMSLDQWNKLPSPYQEIVRTAAHEASTIMMARYDVKNPAALQSILASGIELRAFPDDVLDAAETASFELYDEFASSDDDFAAIFDGWETYRRQVSQWHGLAERSMLSRGAEYGA